MTHPLDVRVHDDRTDLGRAAADDVGALLRSLTRRPDPVRVMFAAAPSQQETLHALAEQPGIDWSKVTAFHMDEYLGLSPEAPQRFGNWLRAALFDRVHLGSVHLIDPGADAQAEAERYGALLTAAPLDVVLLGIGVNGHLAFNDPPADLRDPEPVRVVRLDEASREQQVQDGLFETVKAVPTHALTVTIPCLLSAARVFCMVPGHSKAEAVRAALREPISGRHPATALRTHPAVSLYLDKESAPNE